MFVLNRRSQVGTVSLPGAGGTEIKVENLKKESECFPLTVLQVVSVAVHPAVVEGPFSYFLECNLPSGNSWAIE